MSEQLTARNHVKLLPPKRRITDVQATVVQPLNIAILQIGLYIDLERPFLVTFLGKQKSNNYKLSSSNKLLIREARIKARTKSKSLRIFAQ
jgi:hypothetical protein